MFKKTIINHFSLVISLLIFSQAAFSYWEIGSDGCYFEDYPSRSATTFPLDLLQPSPPKYSERRRTCLSKGYYYYNRKSLSYLLENPSRGECFRLSRGESLNDVVLRGALLKGASFSRKDMLRVNLSESNLSFAKLVEVNLTGSNLRGANLREANLRGAIMDNADLSSANLLCLKGLPSSMKGAKFNSSTQLPFDMDTALSKGMVYIPHFKNRYE